MGESLQDLQSFYETFLRDENETYINRIVTSVEENTRWSISMQELRRTGRANQIIADPLRHLRALERAAFVIGVDEHASLEKQVPSQSLKVGIIGPIDAKPHSPRSLQSSELSHLVCLEGVATKVSSVKPKITQSVHYSEATQQHSQRDYVDATDSELGLRKIDESGQELPDRYVQLTKTVYPTRDADENPLETEFGLCRFKDHQTIVLQEMPEKAPMGQLPRSVELILDNDLVDAVKPGDRLQVTGVYRALGTAGSQTSSGTFRSVVLVNHIVTVTRDVRSLSIVGNDIKTIKQLGTLPNILQILGNSVAPSIHGHERIKQAIALQMLSGMEKNLENGTHLRGDINILMVGDPSTAKSQLLRSAMAIAPLSVSTTGKGSSGVGLTAAVTSDPDTRERRLEAGAMVLADRGLVCVDEFDKMGENDRVAIHEAMEQQTVTIAKAGIHASLNARCSVLAAANPVYGQYDKKRRIQENIGLPDSLLSRFDLLFIVLDQMDPETDRRIARHVLSGHRTKDASMEDDDDDELRSMVWKDNLPNTVLTLDVLRKFILYAKFSIQPVLTDQARDYISSKYSELRARQDDNTVPITARSLETMIRLSTAHAKARLSKVVETQDCSKALEILQFALYHEQSNELVESVPDCTSPNKRMAAVDDDEALSSSPSKKAKQQQSLETAKQQLWDDLCELDALELQNYDPQAVASLEADGRITVSDNVIYKM